MKSKPRAGRTGPAGRNSPALRAQGTVVTKRARGSGRQVRVRPVRPKPGPTGRAGGREVGRGAPRRRPPSAGWTALASQPFPVLPQVGTQNAVNGHTSFFTLITKQCALLSGTVQVPPPRAGATPADRRVPCQAILKVIYFREE